MPLKALAVVNFSVNVNVRTGLAGSNVSIFRSRVHPCLLNILPAESRGTETYTGTHRRGTVDQAVIDDAVMDNAVIDNAVT